MPTVASIFQHLYRGLVLALPVVNQILHLLIFCHNEVLDLLSELLNTTNEVKGLIVVVNLGKDRLVIILTQTGDDAALKLRCIGEHPALLALLTRSTTVPSGKASLLLLILLFSIALLIPSLATLPG